MRLPIAESYIVQHGSVTAAMRAFVADLMRGDAASFKAGYTRENAILATASAFNVNRHEVEELVL